MHIPKGCNYIEGAVYCSPPSGNAFFVDKVFVLNEQDETRLDPVPALRFGVFLGRKHTKLGFVAVKGKNWKLRPDKEAAIVFLGDDFSPSKVLHLKDDGEHLRVGEPFTAEERKKVDRWEIPGVHV